MYKLILWDIDGTLLDFLAAEAAAIRSCFSKFELGECTDEMLHLYSKINVKYWEMLEREELTKPEVLVGRFKEFFETVGIDSSYAVPFNDEYQIRLGDTIVFCDDSYKLISELKDKYIQCVVSNGTIIAQTRKIEKSGLNKIMDKIYLSEQLGYEKPNIHFFDKLFADYPEISKDEMIIIGDSLTSDIRGGNNVGITTCWYNPKHCENNAGVCVDYEISNLNKILEILH